MRRDNKVFNFNTFVNKFSKFFFNIGQFPNIFLCIAQSKIQHKFKSFNIICFKVYFMKLECSAIKEKMFCILFV